MHPTNALAPPIMRCETRMLEVMQPEQSACKGSPETLTPHNYKRRIIRDEPEMLAQLAVEGICLFCLEEVCRYKR